MDNGGNAHLNWFLNQISSFVFI